MTHILIDLFGDVGVQLFQQVSRCMHPIYRHMRVRMARSEKDRGPLKIPFILIGVNFISDEAASQADDAAILRRTAGAEFHGHAASLGESQDKNIFEEVARSYDIGHSIFQYLKSRA